jgi:hypothetical protein
MSPKMIAEILPGATPDADAAKRLDSLLVAAGLSSDQLPCSG